MSVFDCIIIGAGPAGMTASIYLRRANKNILLLEKNAPGGQMVKSNSIQNYPGFIDIDGASLSLNMFNQINNLGVNYQYGDVQRIEHIDNQYKIITGDGEYFSKNIIIATGRSPLSLGLLNEEKLIGHGVSYCATCDGSLYKDKIVGVVGGGNTAFEETLYLSNICKKVYLFNRSNKYRADDILLSRANDINNIEIKNNSNVTKLIEDNKHLSKIIINDNDEYEISCLFVFIGQIPTKFIIDGIKTENDYIIVDKNMKTNLPHIYACGDVIKKDFYQISIAVGEGTIAALNVLRELKK